MAAETALESGQHLRIMRRPVAVDTLGNPAVPVVTERAVDFAVCASGACPDGKDVGMAGRAVFRIGIRGQTDLQGLMGGVAAQAGHRGLLVEMGGMALRALRNAPVPFAVAGCALLPGVRTGKLGQLFSCGAVAVAAGLGQLLHARQPEWCMRVVMAAEAPGEFLAVYQLVAGCALRHDGGIVATLRIVRMEDPVALLAVDAVPATVCLQAPELAGVAAAAFGSGHGCGLDRIGVAAVPAPPGGREYGSGQEHGPQQCHCGEFQKPGQLVHLLCRGASRNGLPGDNRL